VLSFVFIEIVGPIFEWYNRINMDISHSSDDEESVIINKKTSFKVGLLSRVYEIIALFI
jgi:hypothetical protein